jgi:hypothetical protein
MIVSLLESRHYGWSMLRPHCRNEFATLPRQPPPLSSPQHRQRAEHTESHQSFPLHGWILIDSNPKSKKPSFLSWAFAEFLVAKGGIEPPTRGFSRQELATINQLFNINAEQHTVLDSTPRTPRF